MTDTAPGEHWVTATPGELTCGEGPDARYCAVFWAKQAECEALRSRLKDEEIAAAKLAEELADEAEPARQWAVLELMGRRQAIGAISETTLAGRQMISIDRIDTEPAATQHYGPESVYCLTPVTEQQARLLASRGYKTHIVPPALTAALDADDADDGEGPWGFTEDDV